MGHPLPPQGLGCAVSYWMRAHSPAPLRGGGGRTWLAPLLLRGGRLTPRTAIHPSDETPSAHESTKTPPSPLACLSAVHQHLNLCILAQSCAGIPLTRADQDPRSKSHPRRAALHQPSPANKTPFHHIRAQATRAAPFPRSRALHRAHTGACRPPRKNNIPPRRPPPPQIPPKRSFDA